MGNVVLVVCGAIVEVAAAGAIIWGFVRWGRKLVEGQKCQLRSDILRTYYHCCKTKRIRQYEAENLEKNYSAYKALGGNSFIDKIYDEYREWKVVS